MSGGDVTRLLNRIDDSIKDSDLRIQEEIASYIELNPSRVGEQIVKTGHASIPTFAGIYTLTEAQLEEIVREANSLETA
jgi:hypothetical protein